MKYADQFKAAMIKEVDDQMKGKVSSMMPISEVPERKTKLPAVWQICWRRDIKTKQVKKYKARLNIDGSRMIKGQHYDQTYAPVASWKFMPLLLILVAKYDWYSRQLDYVLSFSSDNDNMKLKDTPAKCLVILKRASESKNFSNSFHYRSIIGKINYLKKTHDAT